MSLNEHPSAPPARDAQALAADLRRLEDLQEQIDRLRSALPALVAPLTRPDLTKAERFARLKAAAVGASTGIATLRADWTAAETQDVLQRAADSRAADPDLSKARQVEMWGWNEEREG